MPARSQTARRSFLKALGAAGIGTVALPQIVPSHLFGADAPSNKVNVAIFACGSRGRQLLPSVLRSGGNVVAICDVDARQVAKMKMEGARHGAVGASVEKAKVYEDYRKLLDDEKSVEAVVVCPGQRWHVPMSKRALNAGKHVYCEKPLAHSAAQAREIRELGRQTRLATQVGSQYGASNTFRRSMEVIQAGVLGPVREVHAWIAKGCGPSREFDTQADPIPAELNWDFWCGPSKVLPFKNHYLGDCEKWGPWLEFGDGYLADMGAHCLNLPWRALKLTAPLSCTFRISEPLKDSYPSSSSLRWEFPARQGMPPVALWWHDGGKGGPPEELGKELLSTYNKVPGEGVLFAGEKGILLANAPGSSGVVKLKGDAKCRGVQDHEACKPVPVTIPRAKGQDHLGEWLDACRGGPKTFQGFDTAAMVAEIAMVGMTALRFGKPIEWDSEALKAKGAPEADPFIHRELRTKWL